MKQAKWFLLLHVILGIYAGSSVCSKPAAQQPFLSAAFIVLYGLMLLALVTYAAGWQQVIKHLPLTTAYANKAVTVVWGILLGLAVFGEAVTPRQVIGAVIIICGIVLFVRADNEGRAANESGTAALCAVVSVQHVPLRGLAGAFEEGRAAEHKSVLAEYTDWRVILGYALFVGCTLLTMLAYKGVPLNVGPVLEATGYIYVTIFGVTIFHEKMNLKLAALAMILVGILVYAL